MNHVSFFMYEFESVIEAFLSLRGWVYALPVIYQVLVMAGLVALTVGVFMLVYYVVKGSLVLVFEIIKATLNILKSLVESISRHASGPIRQARRRQYPLQHHRPVAPVAPIAPVAPVALRHPIRTKAPRPLATTVKQALHCPECGETFTPEMMGLLKVHHAVFCEYCGKQLEFVSN
ncbi:MAG: hypothetical protein ACTSRK_14440 [Promethearchaeota archaeon]